MLNVQSSLVTLSVALLLSGPVLAGGQHSGGHGHHDSASAGEAVERTIQVTMDGMTYSPDSIRVERGETIRFVVHNPDQLVHEFSIAEPAEHREHQQEMQAMMDAGVLTPTEYHDEGHHRDSEMAHDHANSVLVEPGETQELVWTFDEAADLEFACNVPGHYQAGMHGEIHWVD